VTDDFKNGKNRIRFEINFSKNFNALAIRKRELKDQNLHKLKLS
jgi:hypothetical protein